MKTDWFAAHKEGLRQIAERLVERRGFGIIGGELYQNVMDTTATKCLIRIEMQPGGKTAQISVLDNGPGYADLTHAWTVYAPSVKKDDPTKAGRFNVGCKMALAFCRNAYIYTTSGSVQFNNDGREEFPRRKRSEGTEFSALIDCNRERYEQFLDYMDQLIVRPGLTLIVNGKEIPSREPIHKFEVALPTEIGEDLRRSVRKTIVEVYDPSGAAPAMLYELGIPIVETGDKWSYNVLQKVPLNVDRDNVTPAYLRTLRTAVFNEMHQQIEKEDTTDVWVQEAASDEACKQEAVKTYLDQRYGKARVSFDPSNPDANAAALVSGFTIIPSLGLTTGQRSNAKQYGLLQSSSAAFPKAGKEAYSDDPNAKPVDVVQPDRYTEGMQRALKYTVDLGFKLLNENVCVRFVNCKSFVGKPWRACFGGGAGQYYLDYNIWILGKKFFDKIDVELNELIIHEFAHKFAPNHASDEFHDACCRLGAKLTKLALEEPEFFKEASCS